MTHILQSPANDPLRDPAAQYVLALVNGPLAADPETAEEHVICAPIEKLTRKLRAGGRAHARLTDQGIPCDFVREVLAKDEGLVLTPLVKDPDLEDIPIDEVDVRGYVVTYTQTFRS